ncbi:MAG TPA: PQQ-dependent sugar dehydrogenase [Amaricoccus sp.]|uniref:PQQ-dependent sugar dehydrogenase n=1 Tax=Amaricoccus sp. TaxID=1872485 RepID=UPI002C1AA032|nr:PQQ-dependent sugar dehydrogenase [Amaricoccus sp.]HMQ94527.1 PQQ-dependent sugar dehydrogenase [Amaricoccus sp.]HMR54701.1 PQQ-dependent sugar dehydrogenase [Amaricoccus sp.]HMU01535.1 PQQ-dependent sugar dehydrogenase [Amaricoccus sp.]
MKIILQAIALAALAPTAAAAQSAETILPDLNYPWDIEAHGDSIYVTEKAGTLGIFEDGTFRRLPVETSAPILDDRGGGLLGLALRPDFAETRRAVLYQHTGTPDDRTNRVIEVELDGDTWRETRVLIDGIPGHPLYNGGRVAFGPDGMLYVTTGWTENRERPQDVGSLAGKILRVAPDGAIPDDNPFPGSPVWSLGHRNPQGLAWDDDGQLYAAEHGQSGHDEVNLIERGANYGWPLIQGDETADGMRAPLTHSGGGTWAPSGLAWTGDDLLLAGLQAEGVLSVGLDGEVSMHHPTGERIRDVLVVGADIYVITTNRSPRGEGPSRDRLIRLDP